MTAPLKAGRRPARSQENIVIVGAGQAGAQAAFTLRERGFTGALVLLGDEPQLPYQRPPLSKKFLANSLSVDRLLLRPATYYAENGIDLHLHVRVEGIDTTRHRLHLHDGRTFAYDKLLLATGCRARRIAVPGARGNDIHYLRNLQDSLSLRRKLGPGVRVAVIGAGYVGLEVAATARATGATVTVLESDERVMRRVTTAGLSAFMQAVHARNGVDIRCGARVEGFDAGERLEAVIADGERLPTDVAVVGIGAVPNADLAHAAGLSCDDGIVVDEYCRTSHPDVYAAGDCTNHFNALFGARMRLESIQNATDQATTAALNMMGHATAYCEVPWFWSQQYEYKLQSAGLCAACDEVEIRGDMTEGRFALAYRQEGRLVGVDAVNSPRAYLEIRNALRDGRHWKSDGIVDARSRVAPSSALSQIAAPCRP